MMKHIAHRLGLKKSMRETPTLRSRKAYAQWANRYPAAAHNMLMQAEERAMKTLMPDVRGKVVLDLACGTGRWGHWALQQAAQRVIGVDNSLSMLRHGVLQQVIQGQMDAIPLASTGIDVVICGLATGHLPANRLEDTFRELYRVLKPGGIAVISDFHPFLAWSGAQRTFTTDDGRVLAVEHYLHSYADYFQYASSARLQLTAVEETYDDQQSRPLVLALALTKSDTSRNNPI